MQGRAGSRRNAVGQCWGCCSRRQGSPWGRTGNTKAESRVWGSRGGMWGVPGIHCPVAGIPGKHGQNRGPWGCYGKVLGMQGPVPGMPGGQCQGCCKADPGTLQGRARDTAGQSREFQGRAGDSRTESGMQGQMRGSRGCRGATSGMQEAVPGTLQDRCGGSEDAVGQCRGCRSQHQR